MHDSRHRDTWKCSVKIYISNSAEKISSRLRCCRSLLGHSYVLALAVSSWLDLAGKQMSAQTMRRCYMWPFSQPSLPLFVLPFPRPSISEKQVICESPRYIDCKPFFVSFILCDVFCVWTCSTRTRRVAPVTIQVNIYIHGFCLQAETRVWIDANF